MNWNEPTLDVAHGDKALSLQVAGALQMIARHSPDPALKSQIDDITSGRMSARDLMNGEAFNRVLDRVAPDAVRWAAETSAEERRELADRGAADLERVRREMSEPVADPGTPPARATDHSSSDARDPITGRPPTTAAESAPEARRSWRDVVVTPDEPDEDDRYFQDRGRRGWLE
ncbi:hypothetical protein [Nocardia sp. NPDC003963]